jgi:hypothetical protein
MKRRLRRDLDAIGYRLDLPRLTPLGWVVLSPWALYAVLRACWRFVGTRARRVGVSPAEALAMAVTGGCLALLVGLGVVLTVLYWL